MSEVNYLNIQTYYAKGNRDDFIKIACDPNQRDWGIWENGKKEWEDAVEEANSIDIHTVFVSPLRRALQTAYYVFKNHPNFEEITFVVLPKLKEGLKTWSDIPNNINDTFNEFSKKFKHFDTDLFNWYKVTFYYF